MTNVTSDLFHFFTWYIHLFLMVSHSLAFILAEIFSMVSKSRSRMEKIMTLEDALRRIEELEKENAKRSDVSERTIYRYKAYYDQIKKTEDELQ